MECQWMEPVGSMAEGSQERLRRHRRREQLTGAFAEYPHARVDLVDGGASQ